MIVLSQIGLFFILIVLGVFITKIKILDEHSLEGISALVMKISLPAYIFIKAVESADRQSLLDSMIVIPLGFLLYVILFVFIYILEKIFGLKNDRQKIFRASFMFGNIGFMGIPLVVAIYPETALLYVSVLTIVDQLIFWTYGVGLTRPAQKGEKFSVSSLKNMVSPPLIAIVLAVIFIFCGIPVPKLLDSAINTVGATSMPLALIYIGGALYTTDIRPVIRCRELYAGILVKMLLIPAAVYMAYTAFGVSAEMAGTFVYILALPGIELVPMLAKANGSDGDYAVGTIMLTTIASLITIPIVSLILSALS